MYMHLGKFNVPIIHEYMLQYSVIAISRLNLQLSHLKYRLKM